MFFHELNGRIPTVVFSINPEYGCFSEKGNLLEFISVTVYTVPAGFFDFDYGVLYLFIVYAISFVSTDDPSWKKRHPLL